MGGLFILGLLGLGDLAAFGTDAFAGALASDAFAGSSALAGAASVDHCPWGDALDVEPTRCSMDRKVGPNPLEDGLAALALKLPVELWPLVVPQARRPRPKTMMAHAVQRGLCLRDLLWP